ncbi:NADH:ubiquinone reductase (Na(+)-transporting) subunit B [Desulfosarcina ovata]|uniref:Na(+)-translocating NADH-quinone reductase subunit B n=1 Tax=Desulfosarcina ovata subsp. ovata TaxID=2752305 RepID=A0A5K8AE39_9BACT|nr:NADH:ubiquinone reductase (Na(+)-transporting) subunit B [Desulfosarcina ovata]BBO90254.1 Na(+)-translocating NADH-quinone reductase subunit B [Desulfosarcina ovata subsp. ovata]
MKILKQLFNATRSHFETGGKLAKLHPLFDAIETVAFAPALPTRADTHVRDSLDLKRFMTFVIIALLPPFFYGIYNTGYQAGVASGQTPGIIAASLAGAWVVLPMLMVSYGVGLFWEILFASVRGHKISEGFLVTGLLFPMTLPPTIPLWQVAVGISFGVVIGKEIFGGTGRNILNPALTGRAFLFFAYPVNMSGDRVWTAVQQTGQQAVDAVTAATPLALSPLAASGETVTRILADAGYTFQRLFVGNLPGSVGETSTLMILAGAIFLLVTGVANYRIMLGGVLGVLAVAYPGYLLNLSSGGETARLFSVHPAWHLVMGSFAFGIVYMATDPVSAPGMNLSRWIYGFIIGALTVMIRVFNPAYPEGTMLAILFMNIFAPLIDHFVIKARLSKRVPNV